MPKNREADRQTAPEQTVAKAESLYLRETCAFAERAILIIVGATVTVLAGFLSQVWGSAGIPFRTELAQSLTAFGWLFTACFCLPALRLFSLRPALYASWWSIPPFLAWAVGALAAVIYYTTLLDRLGKVILKYAVIATA